MNKITNIYTILATNLKGRLSGRTGYDWEDNIKIDLVWIWTLRGQNKFQSWAHANPIMNFQVQ
jgi:hypothetical protein